MVSGIKINKKTLLLLGHLGEGGHNNGNAGQGDCEYSGKFKNCRLIIIRSQAILAQLARAVVS